ncbi:dioxygenase [Actinocorallia longicatena]|uniref:Protocatechuate 3,4-dioxygenase subunit beta n=1 Tax=Actinocorallia longicatena TaxID=111803 RepID=A0ABP6Q714_9ACTN
MHDATEAARAQRARAELVTEQVLESFAGCPDERLKTLMRALTRHLHAFAREVVLTEAEWEAAIAFLRACGDVTTDARQEFVLLSDVLGLSTQTVCLGDPAEGDATEATVLGPFFAEDAPRIPFGGDLSLGASGEPCLVTGTVSDTLGRPVPGAGIEVWEADADGFYDVQYGDGRTAARGRLRTEEDGSYRFWAVTPTPYPIPHDGPVGRLLQATGRSPMRASHLHFMVTAPGHHRLVTHVFVEGDAFLASDAVFGVRPGLVRTFTRHPAGTPAPGGRVPSGTWTDVAFDIVLSLA